MAEADYYFYYASDLHFRSGEVNTIPRRNHSLGRLPSSVSLTEPSGGLLQLQQPAEQ